MNETNWTTNEIASAYERNFTLLEAARKEYDQAVSDFLQNLHRKLCISANGPGSCEGIEAICTTYGSGFETEISVGLSVHGESAELPTPSGITIKAKAAVSVGGSPGHLRVAATVGLNDRTTRWNIEQLRTQILESPNHTDSKPALQVGGELLALEVPVDGDGVSRAADSIQHLLSLLAPVAMYVVEDQQFTERMKVSLVDCAENLSKSPPMKEGKMNKIDWWKGMHFIQFNASDAPGFWVGYLVQNGCLMYGHNRSNNMPPALENEYFRRVKATPPNKHGNFPAGTLLKSEDLRNKSTEEIESLVLEAFREFYSLIVELRANSVSQ